MQPASKRTDAALTACIVGFERFNEQNDAVNRAALELARAKFRAAVQVEFGTVADPDKAPGTPPARAAT